MTNQNSELRSRLLRVSLNLTTSGGLTRRDNGAIDLIAEARKASRKATTATAKLFDEKDILPLTQKASFIRGAFREPKWTMAWSDEDWRVVPSQKVGDLLSYFAIQIEDMHNLAETLAADWRNVMVRAQALRGDEFRLDDYPAQSTDAWYEWAAMWNGKVCKSMLPQTGNIILDASDEIVAELEKQNQEEVERGVKVAVEDLKTKLEEQLTNLGTNPIDQKESKKAGKEVRKERDKYYDSLYENIQKYAKALSEGMVVLGADNPELQQTAVAAAKFGDSVEVEFDSFKKDESLRKEKMEAAMALAKKMGSLKV